MTTNDQTGLLAFCRELELVSGLRYDEAKAYLFESRLPALYPAGLPAYQDLALRVRAGGPESQRIVEALVTHETFFFRDERTFQVLPELVAQAAGSEPPVIWSVGCSTGQELYSALWTLEEARPGWGLRARAYGLDISDGALERAAEAVYTEFELNRGLSAARRAAYLEPHGRDWRVKAPWRAVASWSRANILDGAPALPRPHVVLCRNILIYFSDANKALALRKLAGRLEPGGTLLLGNSEHASEASGLEAAGLGPIAAYRPRAGSQTAPGRAA